MSCAPGDDDFRVWLGTRWRSTWLGWPKSFSLDPVGWQDGGTLLGGGGWQVTSQGSHREYVIETDGCDTPEAASILQGYRDGAYSKSPLDLIYLHEPGAFRGNVLPKQWSQGALLAKVLGGTTTDMSSTIPAFPPEARLPILAGVIPHRATHATGPGRGVLFQPIPEGYDAVVFGLTFRVLNRDGSLGTPTNSSDLFRLSGDGFLAYPYAVGAPNASFWFARATFIPSGDPTPDPLEVVTGWLPGMGNSGCRFVGNPTYRPWTPHAGGRVSSAFTLREVGDWLR